MLCRDSIFLLQKLKSVKRRLNNIGDSDAKKPILKEDIRSAPSGRPS
jgi:hypothetical protein